MKKVFACLLVLSVLVCCISACAPVQTEVAYQEYTFDTQSGAFVPVGCSLSFTKDLKGYRLAFSNNRALYGKVEQTAMGLELVCHGDAFLQFKGGESEWLETLKNLSKEAQESVAKTVEAREQIFVTNGYLVSSLSVDIIRRITDASAKYNTLDGIYESTNDPNLVYKFEDGMIYGPAYKKDASGNVVKENGNRVPLKDAEGNVLVDSKANAMYEVVGDFVCVTNLGPNGKPNYVDGKKDCFYYLLGSVTYPDNLDELVDSEDDYSKKMLPYAEIVKGKEICFLTKTFYALNEPNT